MLGLHATVLRPVHNSAVPSEWELVLRLAVAALLGGVVGLERELSDQPAGFRTHLLVSLGSCLFAVISAFGFSTFLGDQPRQVTFDPSRVAAQIVSGIGFLGAGAIIRYGMTVRGLTTAASLWVVAAIGLAAALGAYLTASVTAGITLLALWGLKRIRPLLIRGLKEEHEELVLDVEHSLQLDYLVRALAREGITVDHLRVEDEEREGNRQIVLFVKLPPGVRPEQAVSFIDNMPGVRNVDWTP
jgi:putative Mg2+ transporter-C (MgtC) family protein